MGAKHRQQNKSHKEEEKANRIIKNICIALTILAILFIAIALAI